MFNSNILDVAIGMIFVYLLLSLMCSAANEIIELMLKKRAIDLERGIRELLCPGTDSGTDDIVAKLYNHALINNLFGGTYEESRIGSKLRRVLRTQLPSYIPARSFALALMDLVGTVPAATPLTDVKPAAPPPAPLVTEPLSGAAGATVGPPASVTPAQVVVNLPATEGAEPPPTVSAADSKNPPETGNPVMRLREAICNSPLLPEISRRSLVTCLDAAGNDVVKVRENIENWFDSSMDRVSGWYKRRAQLTILVVGSFVAITVNVDTITVAKRLSTDKAVRESLVAAADAYSKANAQPSATPTPAASPSPAASPEAAASSSPTASTSPKPTPEPLPTPPPVCVQEESSEACLAEMKKIGEDENSESCRIAKTCLDPNSIECRREKNLLLACRNPDSAKCKYLSNEQQLRGLSLPIGWDDKSDPKRHFTGWTWAGDRGGWWDQVKWHWLGWLLTALAISLGAPFWFDLLNKFIVIRSAVKPHEKSPEEGSKD